MNYKEILKEYCFNHKKINTHCHHLGYNRMIELGGENSSLFSYLGWCFGDFGDKEKIKKSIAAIRARSCYKWFNLALKQLYGKGDFDEETFFEYNRIILDEEKKDRDFTRFRALLNYEHVIEDAYWNYGDNLGDTELFTPAFRINAFLNGYDPSYIDQDGYDIVKLTGRVITDVDEYTENMFSIMEKAKKNGAVAFKCASAYERGLDFYKATAKQAQAALTKKSPTDKEISDFQSYIFYKICEKSADLDMPLQVHTGLGQVEKTGALNLARAIKDNKNTKFVIFHMSFPCYTEALSLAFNFPNVYLDLCWIPIISEKLAKDCLLATLDMVNLDRICWGCDTWTFEESYGAVIAISEVLAAVLSEKTESGVFTPDFAKRVIDRIMYENASSLYYHKMLDNT